VSGRLIQLVDCMMSKGIVIMYGRVSDFILLLTYVCDYDVCLSFVSSPLMRWLYLYTGVNVNEDVKEDAQH